MCWSSLQSGSPQPSPYKTIQDKYSPSLPIGTQPDGTDHDSVPTGVMCDDGGYPTNAEPVTLQLLLQDAIRPVSSTPKKERSP